MKETLIIRPHNTVVPMMLASDREATLDTIHTDRINQDVNHQERNVVLDDRPPPMNNSEKDLTRKECTTLVLLRSGLQEQNQEG